MKPLATLCLVMFVSLTAVAGGTLTTVAEGNSVPLEDITTPRDFDFTGTVLHASEKSLDFADESDGTIIFPDGAFQLVPRQWDIIHVSGKMMVVDWDKSRRFVSQKIEVVRHGSAIPPIDASLPEINAGRFNFKFVRLRGVFASCVRDEVAPDVFWATLNTDGGRCLLAINASALATRQDRALTDSEVEVVGLPIPISGLRQSLGKCIRVYSSASIKVLKPPPPSPLDAQPFSEANCSPHRQRISGDVVATARNLFFLRTGIGRIIKVVPVPGDPMPHIDDTVIVAGFPEYVPYWLCLSEAIVKVTGRSENPVGEALLTSISDLFTDSTGRKRFMTPITGHRLTLQGKVVAATENELEISDGENSLFIMIEAIRDQLTKMPKVGSLVEATGLCWSEFHNKYESDIYPTFLRFALYPHDAADIRVLASPPWWTPFRLMVLVLILVALLALSLAWSVAVNIKAERRGRELYEERASHAIAEKKVEERTRLAVELHDSLSQTLTGIAMQLDVGNNDTAKTMLTSCRGDLRRCLWDLRSRTFEEKDMTEAIERTLEPHSVGAKIAVRFNVPRERLSDFTTHNILHIVRELVVNAIRHGKATEIKVAGECHDDTISFSVKDNGCGFDPSAAPGPAEGHFGLLGIRERLKALQGTIAVESAPGAGSKFKITINCQPT